MAPSQPARGPPTLRKVADRLDSISTAEGAPLANNTRTERRRYLERVRLLREQIYTIEQDPPATARRGFRLLEMARTLAQWFEWRAAVGRKTTPRTMIVALASKLLIALWRFVTAGEVPLGVVLRPA